VAHDRRTISVAHPPFWALRHVVRPLVDAARKSAV
jgi:hypothetical protein